MGQAARKDVQTEWVFVKTVDLKGSFRQDYEWATQWYSRTEKLVEEGLLRPHPTSTQQVGWEGILTGTPMLRYRQVRGKKLVYAVSI